jgi:nucleoside-diphosphate-sugar epimerase
MPEGVEPIACDLAHVDRLVALLPPKLDGVCFTAGADGPSERLYRAVYVDGLRNLIEALSARTHADLRLIVASSTAVYAQDAGEWVDESSPAVPTRMQGKVMLECERIAMMAPFRTSVVRLGGIYGPGRSRLIEQVRAGLLRPSAAPHYTNRIHRDDAAGFFCHLLSLENPCSLYLGVDDDPADLALVVRWLAAVLDVPVPQSDPDASPVTTGKRCRNRELRTSGYRLLYPSFREGYARMLGLSTS